MSGHTKGPWETRRVGGGPAAVLAGPRTLAHVFSSDGGTVIAGDANARLIAAAPEMAEALEALWVRHNARVVWTDKDEALNVQARAALQKAGVLP